MSDLARVQVEGSRDIPVVVIAGEIDISNVSEIREIIDTHIVDALVLTIDLVATTFLDSAGIALLLEVGERLRTTRRDLYVVIPEDAPIRRLVKLSGLDAQVAVLPSRDDVNHRRRSF